MDTVFENKCTYTFRNFLQFKRKTLDTGFVGTGWAIIGILTALSVLAIVLKSYSVLIFTSVGIVFLLYRVVGTPIKWAKIASQKNQSVHGGRDLETDVSFYEEHLIAVNLFTTGKTNIKYVDVLKLLETKDLYIIEMEKKLAILVDKSGFTKGTEENFAEFIKERCVNAEVKI